MPDPWHAKASEIRTKLNQVRQTAPSATDTVFEAISLLDELEGLYRHNSRPAGTSTASTSSKLRHLPPKALRQTKTYARVRDGDTVYLTESRASGQPAYRVPKAVYDAVARALADAKEPISFTEWHHATQKVVGKNFPDYFCRVVLRFWRQTVQHDIRKVGTRYEACDSKAFPKRATDAISAIKSVDKTNPHS